MASPYEWVMDRRAARSFDALRARHRKQIIDWADSITRFPFHAGHLSYRDRNGREMHVCLVGKIDVHYWCDHAARELRISVIEFHSFA